MSGSLSLSGEIFLAWNREEEVINLLSEFHLGEDSVRLVHAEDGDPYLSIDTTDSSWDVVENLRELVTDDRFSQLILQRGYVTVTDDETGDLYWRVFCIPYGETNQARDIAETEYALTHARMQIGDNRVLQAVLSAAENLTPLLAKLVHE